MSRRLLIVLAALVPFLGLATPALAAAEDPKEFCAAQFTDEDQQNARFVGKACLVLTDKKLKVAVKGTCVWNYSFYWGKPLNCRTVDSKYKLTTPLGAAADASLSGRESGIGKDQVDALGEDFPCLAGKYKLDVSYKAEMMGLSFQWSRSVTKQHQVEIEATC
ncbi:hypothetical protein GCM10022247_24570 [Allokutzneria multivorans]|uniref:Uncharacterized protein n=1 Tax=Allokutzneria multivorans TaxID=1142134 RepID=A0ABP7RVC4_9PSEU